MSSYFNIIQLSAAFVLEQISRLYANEATGFYMSAADYWKALKKGPLHGMGLVNIAIIHFNRSHPFFVGHPRYKIVLQV